MNASTPFKEPRPLNLAFDSGASCAWIDMLFLLAFDSVSLCGTVFPFVVADDSVAVEMVEVFLLNYYLVRFFVPGIEFVEAEKLFSLHPPPLHISSDNS